jgi:uroporphyrinogen decarboxylase
MAMKSKERVRAVLDRQPADRAPVDIWMTGEVFASLQQHTGIAGEFEIWRELGIDKIVWVNAPYTGALRPVAGVETVTHWGAALKKVQAGRAEYLEYCEYPLAGMDTVAELDAYEWWPDPEKFDVDALVAEVERCGDEFATLGPWVSLFEIYCGMRGLEASMMDVLVSPDFVAAALARIEAIQTRLLERMLPRVAGKLDMVFISDDMGSQDSLLVSVDTWQELIQPGLKRWCDLVHAHGVKVFYHSDGAVDSLIPCLIETGIDVLNPIQHVCPGMDLDHLAQAYGDRVIFHGGVDNQHALPFGTPEEVRAETERCFRTLGRSGGYICCSCHNIQAGTPVPNILAMIETAHREGARQEVAK